MTHPFVAAIIAVAAACASAASCGGRSDARGADGGNGTSDDGGTWTDAPWLDDAWRAPACAQITPVPTGDAIVGAWSFDGSGFRRELACDPQGSMNGSRKLAVPAFFLMVQPATNACYAECVSRGACTAPAHDINDPDPRSWNDDHRASQPVYVDHGQAEGFCRWLGGRLPSWAELVRAAQSDAQTLGVAALTKVAVDCALNASGSQLCAQVAQMDFFGGARPLLYPVGQIALDSGPFGHRDLFGSVVEWTSTYFRQDAFCALSDGDSDFGTFAQSNPAHPQHLGLQFASAEARAIRSHSAFTVGLAADATVAYYLGFRCAFSR
jgi:formylglycine-generating enzyme required for sulfatase activity